MENMNNYENTIIPVSQGNETSFTIKRLFDSHGPWTINGKRLDELESVDIILDSSTSSRHETSLGNITANTGSMIGRAAVGGAVFGGAGAVLGGATAKKTTINQSTSVEVRNTELTCKLKFSDDDVLHAIITDVAAYHWLLAFTSLPAATKSELEHESALADSARIRADQEQRAQEIVGQFIFAEKSVFPAVLTICALGGILYVLLIGLSFFKFFGLIFFIFFLGAAISIVLENHNNEKMLIAKKAYDARIKEVITGLSKS